MQLTPQELSIISRGQGSPKFREEAGAAYTNARNKQRAQQDLQGTIDQLQQASQGQTQQLTPNVSGPVGGSLFRQQGPQSVQDLASSRFDQIMAEVGSRRDEEQARLFDALNAKGILGTQAGHNLLEGFADAQRGQELSAVNQAFGEGIRGAEFEFNRGLSALDAQRGLESGPLELASLGANIGTRNAANAGATSQLLGQQGQLSTGNLFGTALASGGQQLGGAISQDPEGFRNFFGTATPQQQQRTLGNPGSSTLFGR